MIYYLCIEYQKEDKMVKTIITTIISVIVSGLLGYCISLVKQYRKKLKEKEKNAKCCITNFVKKSID